MTCLENEEQVIQEQQEPINVMAIEFDIAEESKPSKTNDIDGQSN